MNTNKSMYGEGEVGVVLEENGDRLAEVVQAERADVVPVEQDLALVRVVQSRDELQDRALPGPVCTHDDLRVLSVAPTTHGTGDARKAVQQRA